MAHRHPVYDTDPHFIIDPDSRQITYADSKPVVIIQNDHKSEHFTFELPKEIDGHDMTLCDLVQVHYINIGNNSRNPGLYAVTDLQVLEENPDKVVCSWEITQNATSLSGSLSFMLRFACTTDGTIDYAWNTAIFSSITVSPGLDNTEDIATEYEDVIAQWYQELMAAGGDGVNAVEAAKNEAVKYINDFAENGLVSKATTRNLANLTFKDATLSDSTGNFQAPSNGISNAAAEEYIEVAGGETYTFSWIPNDVYSQLMVYQYDADKAHIEHKSCSRTDENNNKVTLTVGATCAYIRVRFYSHKTDQTWSDLIPDKFQIEAGEEATEYIAPTIIDNENIDLNSHPQMQDVVRQKDIEDVVRQREMEDYIPKVASRNLANLTFKQGKLSDTTGLFQPSSNVTDAAAEEYIEVTGGQSYTFSWEYNDLYSMLHVFEYKADKSFLVKHSCTRTDEVNEFKLVVSDECAFIRIRFYSYNTTQEWYDLIPDKFQIEAGEEATEYVRPLVIDPEVLGQNGGSDRVVDENPVEDVHYLGHKVNQTLGELRAVRNEINGAVGSLLHLKESEGVERTATIKSIGEHKKAFVRVGLHYGSRRYTAKGDELYFDGNCKKDFSDIRFYDAEGNILKAEFGELVNMELSADDNIAKMLKTTSNGKLVGYDANRGIIISDDNAVTWTAIAGTHNVTTNASNVYGYTSMYPIFVDNNNNIFAYAGGMLYKLLASDNYTTKKNVLDFSWVTSEGVTVYPDIQHHGIDADINGNMYFGFYQEGLDYRHIDVYVSRDGGESWNLSYYKYDVNEYVHVHHIHADKYSSKVYVGIDDGGFTNFGSRVIVTEDGGETWTEITEEFDKRGKDYYPTYFGTDYRLGGGETYIMGSATAYRSVDDKHLEPVIRGAGGVRGFADFGNDDVIVCGSLLSSGVAEHHIYVSTDKGQTWKSIYKKYVKPFSAAGSGYRDIHNALQLTGDTEPCVFMPYLWAADTTHHFRVYNGGDHWYREVYVEVENTTDADITIIAKTGHTLSYPYTCLEGREHDGCVYGIPFNEGAGGYVCDSEGNMVAIKGGYKWERDEEPVRYGDYSAPTKTAFEPSSGLLLEEDASINFGKIPALNFKDNFTIAFRFNTKAMFVDGNDWDKYRAHRSEVLSFGDVKLHVNGGRFGWTKGDVSNRTWATVSSFLSHSFTDGYYYLVICLENNVATAYLNGFKSSNNEDAGIFEITSNLSERDLIVGAGEKDTLGYISDIKIYNRVLSEDEVLELYRGW